MPFTVVGMTGGLGRKTWTWLQGARTGFRIGAWPIKWRLVLIVAVLVIPLNVLIAVVIERLDETAIAQQRNSLIYTAEAVAGAVDAEVNKYIDIIRVLSHSPFAYDVSLAEFEKECRHAFPVDGATLVVSDVDGQQLINTHLPPGASLPRRPATALVEQMRAFERGAIIVSESIWVGAAVKDWIASVEAPLFRDGKPFRSVSVIMHMPIFYNLLNAQRIPNGWLAGIIDKSGRIIARVPGNASWVGKFSSEGWRGIMGERGVFELTSLEGDLVIIANAVSKVSGWSIGVAVRKTELERAARSAEAWVLFASVIVSLLSVTLALALARSISSAILRVRDHAVDLQPRAPDDGTLLCPELRELRDALDRTTKERNKAFCELEKANATLERLSRVDGLTGVANRRHFDEAFEMEWGRAQRSSASIGLLMIDIDFFKNFNDGYGHLAGDVCLQAVANAISGVVRHPPDMVARYGGEEFVCMLPGADQAATISIAIRILHEVRNLGIRHAYSAASDHAYPVDTYTH